MTSLRLSIVAASCIALAACTQVIPDGQLPEPQQPLPVAENARELGAVRQPAAILNRIDPRDAADALDSFRRSCRVATTREDVSGLTAPADWAVPCTAAATWPRERADQFFAAQFTPVRVGTGEAFATGYFEPEIAGSRTRRAASDVPVYGIPRDLERCWREDIAMSERTGRAPLSRRLPDGTCVEFDSRTEIENGSLEGRAPVIGYAADAIEFFFLQIQGSGRLVSPTGEVVRIGYAGQNGHGYTGIGSVMRQRGLIGEGTPYATSMQGIMGYLRDYPAEGRAIMRENASWIFFQELSGPDAAIGPLGSIGVPVVGQSSVAVDPKFVPYGAPVVLELDRDQADGLWVAQDTGGAIRGPNRFDTFWGAGAQAREIAGGMSGRGQALVLLPNAAAARLPR
ncbi:murein transglycosylase A [Aurantiacibacter arachoides]|uniref:murein transglycosylase A n=1 Tax=Aurantiacibacter arachoides TaxID=1850444 RepID=UPI00198EEA6F|nr:MltA domain-containing protein [Aurantiacibacter arachoides]GGD58705.1 murein transglycosylase [Aurantiacibacter arachoides]